MVMVDMKDLLHHAYNNHYAVGAFEVVNLDFLQAVMDAAEFCRSPVIINIVVPHQDLYDVELLTAACVRAAKRANVPVALHMDHCHDLASVQEAIRLGCNSVMFDAASEAFTVNVDRSREVAAMAHACGIPVEGEIGCVTGYVTDKGEPDTENPIYTHVEEARAYIEKTGVDFLAVSIGTVHGRVKSKQRLDFARLARIQEKANIPCVIHGGTGLSDQQYHKLVDHGVAKINYFTAMADAGAKQIAANLLDGEVDYQSMIGGVREQISAQVKHYMQILNSAGRAAEVMIQCKNWHNIEHVIVYEPSTDDQTVIYEMLRKGKQQLNKIPGVLDVQIGSAPGAKGRYRYCWLIRFAHEDVIESYKTHPFHVSYADNYFRPIAGDRITNNYEILDTLQRPEA